MKVALVGPNELTPYDQEEIKDYIDALVSEEHEIVLLAYRSIEIEVLKYFVDHVDIIAKDEQGNKILDENGNQKIINHAPKLHIVTFQAKKDLPSKLRTAIDYLVENGSNYFSLEYNDLLIRRSVYIEAWGEIIKEVDAVVSFYDGEKTTLMIPIDEAKKRGKKAFIYQLPRTSLEKANLTADKKIKIVK